jgi:hypothetical protein
MKHSNVECFIKFRFSIKNNKQVLNKAFAQPKISARDQPAAAPVTQNRGLQKEDLGMR